MLSEIRSKINSAPNLDFGDIFNESISLFKKSWLYGFVLQLFVLVLSSPLIIVIYVPMVMAIVAQSKNGEPIDPNYMSTFFAGLSFIYMVFLIIGVLIISALSLLLNAGLFKILRRLDHGEDVKIADLFCFFKSKYIGKMFLLMLIYVVIAIPSALLCYIPLIYAIVPLSFFIPVFAFNPDLSVGDIVKASFWLGNKKWLLTFGLLIVTYVLVVILTVITCGLGSLFLSPFFYHPVYLIYKKVIGFDNDSNVTSHIVE